MDATPQPSDAEAPTQPSSPAAVEPVRPPTDLERAMGVRLGDQVMVGVAWVNKRLIQRPAVVVAVWPGEFGQDEPPGVNVQVELDGTNDNSTLAIDTPLGLGMHQARRALACEQGRVWLTSVRYGVGVPLWTLRGPRP